MDHNESIREFERLLEREAAHAHHFATELEALAASLPGEKSRQLARQEAKARREQSKELQELAKTVKED